VEDSKDGRMKEEVRCAGCRDLIPPGAPVYCDESGSQYHDSTIKRCRPDRTAGEPQDTVENAKDLNEDGDFREEDVRTTYRLLGHEKETEMRLIDPSGERRVEIAFVHGEEEFVQVCKKHNGLCNIYAGVNERKPGGTRAEDVVCVHVIPFDVDALRPKNEASTEEELQRARSIAHRMMDYFRSEGKNPYLAMSGNGFQLWFRVSIPIDDEIRFKVQEVIQDLQKQVMEEFSNDKVKIDNVGDLPRIIKVIGTLSIKGSNTKERPRRVSRWEEPPTHFEPDLKWSKKVYESALTTYKDEAEPEAIEGQAGLSKERLRNHVEQLDQKGKDLFQGAWQKYGFQSRSEGEQSLAVKLAILGMTETEAWAVMEQSQIGKWKEEGDAYKRLTLAKAFAFAATKGAGTKAKVENGGGGTAFPSYVVLTVTNPPIIISVTPRKEGGHTLHLPEELGSQILDFYPGDPRDKILDWVENALEKAGVARREEARAVLGARLFSSVNWYPKDFLRQVEYFRLRVGQIHTIPVRIEGEVVEFSINAENMDTPTALKKKLLAHNINLLVPKGKWSGILGTLMDSGKKRPFDPTLERGFNLVEDVKNWVLSREDVVAQSPKDLEGTNFEFPVWIGGRLGVHNKKVETMAKIYKIDEPRKLSRILDPILLPHIDEQGAKHNTMALQIGKNRPRFWLLDPAEVGVKQKKLDDNDD
jgi:hypothetical protein